jgi:hypothetical protein
MELNTCRYTTQHEIPNSYDTKVRWKHIFTHSNSGSWKKRWNHALKNHQQNFPWHTKNIYRTKSPFGIPWNVIVHKPLSSHHHQLLKVCHLPVSNNRCDDIFMHWSFITLNYSSQPRLVSYPHTFTSVLISETGSHSLALLLVFSMLVGAYLPGALKCLTNSFNKDAWDVNKPSRTGYALEQALE